MRVIIGSDHGGFELKEKVKNWLVNEGREVVDVGNIEYVEDDDYVDFAKKAIEEARTEDKVILFCRNGFGMIIAANRFSGVRCGLAFDKEAVRRGRTDDDINCLAVPADYVDEGNLFEMIKVFLSETFDNGENYKRRILKLDSILK